MRNIFWIENTTCRWARVGLNLLAQKLSKEHRTFRATGWAKASCLATREEAAKSCRRNLSCALFATFSVIYVIRLQIRQSQNTAIVPAWNQALISLWCCWFS